MNLLTQSYPKLFIAVLISICMHADIAVASDDKAAPAKKKVCTLYHVFGDVGKEFSIPKELKPFAGHLKRTLKKKFTFTKTKVTLTEGKLKSYRLPLNLGKVTITLMGKGVVITLLNAKGKKLGTISSKRWPAIVVNDKLKSGSKQYILILKAG